MKVDTPQILWHSEKKNLPAALTSVSLCESGIDSHCLATSGNSDSVHLWKYPNCGSAQKIEFLCNLSRHEGPVNKVCFSNNGLFLATAGETGYLIVWSVPASKRGNNHGQHFWTCVSREQDLEVKIAFRNGEPLTDLSWSQDSKRLVLSSLDHSVIVLERSDSDEYRSIYRNSTLHTHFVQGVAYDPLGVYIASASSDRTVRVLNRKTSKKSKKLDISMRSKQIKYFMDEEKKSYLFGDEATLESFCRRLAWTPDGGYLIVPGGLWNQRYSTMVFARHKFDQPATVLGGLEKVRFVQYAVT